MIKTIPTTYNGIKFRSRLEARWAVFFDSINIKYRYEFEGFELEDNFIDYNLFKNACKNAEKHSFY
jgi:hypothetical protein